MTQNKSQEAVQLLPCPFCGKSDAFVERADFSSCYVMCNDCSAKGPCSCDENEADADASYSGDVDPGELPARRLWNTRPTPQPIANAGEAIDRPSITAAEFKSLPENIRRYVMMLETDCDPSGTIRSEMMLRDTVEALEKKRVDETWRCTCCRSEFQYDGEARPNCPHCKAFDQYTYRGGFAPGERLPSAPEGDAAASTAGWIVGYGDDQWCTWESGMPERTGDRDKATRYARREDAEAVHRDDEDAVRVVPYLPANAQAEGSEEPTRAMRKAGAKVYVDRLLVRDSAENQAAAIWSAMIAASKGGE